MASVPSWPPAARIRAGRRLCISPGKPRRVNGENLHGSPPPFPGWTAEHRPRPDAGRRPARTAPVRLSRWQPLAGLDSGRNVRRLPSRRSPPAMAERRNARAAPLMRWAMPEHLESVACAQRLFHLAGPRRCAWRMRNCLQDFAPQRRRRRSSASGAALGRAPVRTRPEAAPESSGVTAG